MTYIGQMKVEQRHATWKELWTHLERRTHQKSFVATPDFCHTLEAVPNGFPPAKLVTEIDRRRSVIQNLLPGFLFYTLLAEICAPMHLQGCVHQISYEQLLKKFFWTILTHPPLNHPQISPTPCPSPLVIIIHTRGRCNLSWASNCSAMLKEDHVWSPAMIPPQLVDLWTMMVRNTMTKRTLMYWSDIVNQILCIWYVLNIYRK